MTTAGLASLDQGALRPARPEGKPPRQASRHMILVEPRALFRECLSDRLSESDLRSEVAAYASLRDVEFPCEKANSVLALLLSLPPSKHSESDIAKAISLAQCRFPKVPIVVIADCEEPTFVRNVISFGAQGYIPTSVDFIVFKEALEFIRAGGIFAPAGALVGCEHQWSSGREGCHLGTSGLFAQDESRHTMTERCPRMTAVNLTRREQDVIDQLREGKSNKMIARELGISEGTVKLHLQRIMRKLHVNNRTQVALLAGEIPISH
jgi:DNA-binding NarL/FixJ family response regulator